MKINEKMLVILMCIYCFAIFIFDYTFIYRIAAILTFVFTLLFRKKIMLFNDLSKMYILLIIFFFFHTILGFSVNTDNSWNMILTLCFNFLCIVFSINILNKKENIEKIMMCVIITSIIGCIYIVYIDFSNLFSGTLGEYALKPFFNITYSHNDISMLAAIGITFLSYFKVTYNKKRTFYTLLQVLLMIFIVLTGARKSLILGIIGIFVYTYLFSYKDDNQMKKILKVFLGFFLVIVFCFFIMKNEFLYNIIGRRFEGFFNGIFNGVYTESSANSRSIMIKTAVNLIKNNFFIGYGLDTFRTFSGSFGTWSHNNYLELAVSGGVLIPILYYYSYFIILLKVIKKDNSTMKGMCLCLMLFLFIHDYLSVSYLSRSILLLLCIICSYLKSNDNWGVYNEKKLKKF